MARLGKEDVNIIRQSILVKCGMVGGSLTRSLEGLMSNYDYLGKLRTDPLSSTFHGPNVKKGAWNSEWVRTDNLELLLAGLDRRGSIGDEWG